MPATIFNHPKHEVKLKDPREQEVAEDGYVHAGPDLTTPAPILLALRGTLPADTCAACGEAIAYHYSVCGRHKLDCADVPARKRSPRNPLHWSDASPDVTCAVRKALLLDCGPGMDVHCASYTHEELLQIARTVAKAATKAIRERDRQDARGTR
jgi:hypothetical protein